MPPPSTIIPEPSTRERGHTVARVDLLSKVLLPLQTVNFRAVVFNGTLPEKIKDKKEDQEVQKTQTGEHGPH